MNFKTAKNVEWINAHDCFDNQLPIGQNVLALTRGGKLIETVWTENSIDTCDAFMYYPKIPVDIRELQSRRNIGD